MKKRGWGGGFEQKRGKKRERTQGHRQEYGDRMGRVWVEVGGGMGP